MNKILVMTMSATLFGFSGLTMAEQDDLVKAGEERMRKMMEKYDTDGDGKLSNAEREASHKEHLEREKKKIDTDGDGEISEEERNAWSKKWAPRPIFGTEEMKKRFVEEFDVDGDGKLSEKEMKDALDISHKKSVEKAARMAERKKNYMDKYDTNRDGKISADEKEAVIQAYKDAREAFKAEMLENYDADGDGKLSRDEKAVARQNEKQELLEKFDADGNGEIEGKERLKAGAWIRKHRPFRMMSGFADRFNDGADGAVPR